MLVQNDFAAVSIFPQSQMRPSTPSEGNAPAFASLSEALARGMDFFAEPADMEEHLRFETAFKESYPLDQPFPEPPRGAVGMRPPIDHVKRAVEDMVADKYGPLPEEGSYVGEIDGRFSLVSVDSDGGEEYEEVEEFEEEATAQALGVVSTIADATEPAAEEVNIDSEEAEPLAGDALVIAEEDSVAGKVHSSGTETTATPKQQKPAGSSRKTTERATRSILRRRPEDSPLIAPTFPEVEAGDDEGDSEKEVEVPVAAEGLVYAYESDGSPLSRRPSVASRMSNASSGIGDEENVAAAANAFLEDGKQDKSEGSFAKKRVSIAPCDTNTFSEDAALGSYSSDDDGPGDAPDFYDESPHQENPQDHPEDDAFDGVENASSGRSGGRAPLAVVPLNLAVSISPDAKLADDAARSEISGKKKAAGKKVGRKHPGSGTGTGAKAAKVNVPKREMRSLDVARARRALEREGEDEIEEGVRRSRRQKFPVLKWWKSESITYERRDSRLMPTIAQIELASSDSEQHVAARPAPRRRQKRAPAAADTESDAPTRPRKRGRPAATTEK